MCSFSPPLQTSGRWDAIYYSSLVTSPVTSNCFSPLQKWGTGTLFCQAPVKIPSVVWNSERFPERQMSPCYACIHRFQSSHDPILDCAPLLLVKSAIIFAFVRITLPRTRKSNATLQKQIKAKDTTLEFHFTQVVSMGGTEVWGYWTIIITWLHLQQI